MRCVFVVFEEYGLCLEVHGEGIQLLEDRAAQFGLHIFKDGEEIIVLNNGNTPYFFPSKEEVFWHGAPNITTICLNFENVPFIQKTQGGEKLNSPIKKLCHRRGFGK